MKVSAEASSSGTQEVNGRSYMQTVLHYSSFSSHCGCSLPPPFLDALDVA